jgi:hypothetical protein
LKTNRLKSETCQGLYPACRDRNVSFPETVQPERKKGRLRRGKHTGSPEIINININYLNKSKNVWTK